MVSDDMAIAVSGSPMRLGTNFRMRACINYMFYNRIEESTEGKSKAARVSGHIEKRAANSELEMARMKDDIKVRQAEKLIGISQDDEEDMEQKEGGTSEFVRKFDKDVHKGLQASEVSYTEAARRLMATE